MAGIPRIVSKFGPKTINPGTGRLVSTKGKGGGQQTLPSRFAMDRLTGGDPVQRSLGNYAKLTPTLKITPESLQDVGDALGPSLDSVPEKYR